MKLTCVTCFKSVCVRASEVVTFCTFTAESKTEFNSKNTFNIEQYFQNYFHWQIFFLSSLLTKFLLKTSATTNDTFYLSQKLFVFLKDLSFSAVNCPYTVVNANKCLFCPKIKYTVSAIVQLNSFGKSGTSTIHIYHSCLRWIWLNVQFSPFPRI